MSYKDKPMSEIEKAIASLEDDVKATQQSCCRGLGFYDTKRNVYLLAIAALHAQAARESPEPLTLEQLREIERKPMWLVQFGNPDQGKWVVRSGHVLKQIHRNNINNTVLVHFEGSEPQALDVYGKTWLAYAHKPAGEV